MAMQKPVRPAAAHNEDQDGHCGVNKDTAPRRKAWVLVDHSDRQRIITIL